MTGPGAPPPAPLAGVTVIDLTIALAGPYATLLLAGLGATVIKVENPRGGDRVRNNAPYFGRDGLAMRRRHDDDMSLGALERTRGKRSITLDLKHPSGREVFADLVAAGDVVVENYSSGTADRLGVGYEAARAVNEAIVYCSISGFGVDRGTGAGKKAMDVIIQALSGAMMTSGEPGDAPVRVGIPVGDLTAPLFAVIGILSALRVAEHTGVGQHVDVSMLGALSALVASEQSHLTEQLGRPIRSGRFVPRLAPFGVFRTADGWLAISAPEDRFAAGVFAAMGRDDLTVDPRFVSRDERVHNADELHDLIEQWSSGRPRSETLTALEANGVPCAPVRSPAEALVDPLTVGRGDTVELAHPGYGGAPGLTGSGLPIHLSGTPAGFATHVPSLGADNDDVYGSLLGYAPATVARLRADGVI